MANNMATNMATKMAANGWHHHGMISLLKKNGGKLMRSPLHDVILLFPQKLNKDHFLDIFKGERVEISKNEGQNCQS